MALTVLAYRDDLMTGDIDSYLWRQLGLAFGVRTNFLENERPFNSDEVVVFDETGDIPLAEFKHPEDAVYVFGATTMERIQRHFPNAPSVRIEVPVLTPRQGLFGAQAAAIVLYDRERKSWQ